jgi:hypothetical protein
MRLPEKCKTNERCVRHVTAWGWLFRYLIHVFIIPLFANPAKNQVAPGILYSCPAHVPRSILFSLVLSRSCRIRPDRQETEHEVG